ncbi:RHS repeat-associated core domain-containing protein [Kitasatospora sp. NPDC058170]|uniref:RHS repeat-associated core domain-containing protein n=1 Tax=Kitasatospora sp. NPDC058170 TaxID=3346364 RepID=UPI0036D7F9B7
MELRHALGRVGRARRRGRWSPGLAALLALTLTGVVVPPSVAWAAPPESEDLVWSPPQTPLGADTPSVPGRDHLPGGKGSKDGGNPPPRPESWTPVVAAPVVPGKATVQLGADGPAAKAARAATGGASPASGGATVSRAGTLPVLLAPATGDAAPAADAAAATPAPPATSVSVEVTDAAKGRAAGADSALVALTDADPAPSTEGRRTRVTLDLKGLQAAAWADRARLVALPACALTTPERDECRTRTPVESTVEAGGRISADVLLPGADAAGSAKTPAPATKAAPGADAAPGTDTAPAARSALAAPMVLAAESTASGAGGSYAATPLAPSMDWSAGSNVGSFTYNYTVQTPPTLGGLGPSVVLGYNSSAVDGRTSATNSQSSWIGDGWSYEPGFVERSYRTCDKAGDRGIKDSGDRCWGGQNATLSLAGRSGTLVRDDTTGVWHLQSDDGSKVEQLTGAPRGAGEREYKDTEYWRITTPDGTEYYFGSNHLPGGDGTDPAARSVLTNPVYSPNPGDPCYSASTGKGSWCQMAWRWQLDYVVDTHKNLITYRYAPETNHYSRGGGQNNGNGTLTAYERSATLAQIGYNQRYDEQKAAKGALTPGALVAFDATAERCNPGGAVTCAEDQRTTANADAWPDVPLDQLCASSGTCTNYGPSFFSTKRLTSITTQVATGSGQVTVDSWALGQSLVEPGDGTKRTLWLDSIRRTGTNGHPEAKLPAVTFAYKMIANRVDGLVPASPMFMRPRVREITTETGGRINVRYSDAECSRVNNHMPASADSNAMACMPVNWYPPGRVPLPGQTEVFPVNDWFTKPLVLTVTEQDLVTSPSTSRTTEYTYHGPAAWHRDDAEFTDPKARTWDYFRGYEAVTTTTGSAATGEAPKTQKKDTYLRGMDGDYRANGSTRSVDVASPLGGTVKDSDWLAGTVVATEVFDRAGGTVQAVSGSVRSGQTNTATQTQSAGAPKIYARYPDSQVTEISKSKLANGTWNTTTSVTTTDPAHGNRVLSTSDKGDGTAATPELCTTLEYAVSDNPVLMILPAGRTTVQGPCTATATAANTVGGSRTLYDGRPFKQAGTIGDATAVQVLDHYDGAGKPVYTHGGSTTYDAYGRTVTTATPDGSSYDANGAQLSGVSLTPAVTGTTRSPATGLFPTTVTTTGPLGADWTAVVNQEPGRGLALNETDANQRTTTQEYDGLGRRTAVWIPGRDLAELPNQRFSYDVNGTAGPSVITSEWLQRSGGTYSGRRELFDGLGRTRQVQQTSDARATGRLITDTVYDSHGWVIKTSSPYYEATTAPSTALYLPQDSQVPAQTWTSYDGLGRPVRAEFRSNANLQWATTTAYRGADRVDVTPPDGGTPTTTITDARGRTVAAWQYRTATPTGNPADADISTYTYTALGQPATHKDAVGNTWTYTYDLLGRQTSITDPDAGTSRTFYDANSRVDHTVDDKGSTLAFTYDLIGRKTGQYNGSVAPANQLGSWTYDTLAKGKPTSSTRYVGGADGAAYVNAVTGYDVGYRPTGTAVTIPSAEGALAGTYETAATYEPVLGLVDTLTLPAAGGLPSETIGYTYNDTGLLVSSKSLKKSVVAEVIYDAAARPVRTTVGPYGRQVASTQQYDWATGRVVNSFVDRQNGTVSADQTTYTYSASGRITSVTDLQDARDRDLQCFTYDALGRLTNAWTDTGGTHTTADWTDSSGVEHGTGSSTNVPGVGGCDNATGPAAVSPGGRTVGGPAPYWNTYGYDATGNRTRLVQHDISGNSLNDTTTTQTFGAAGTRNTPTSAPNTGGGTGGPHALLNSTSTGPAGTKTTRYQYDAAGNTTAITDTSGTTSLAWNAEGKPTTVGKTGTAGDTTYVYDADGNQLVRHSPGKTVLLVGSDELTLDTATGATTNTRSLSGGGGLTFTRNTAAVGGGTVLIQAADPHGTNGVQIGIDAAMTVTRRSTDPFGNPRGTQPAASAWGGTKGFVGGLADETTGLTSLGARQYDPATGRFISPDPILDPANPLQWNSYAYSYNDPVNTSDPSGLYGSWCATQACAEQTQAEEDRKAAAGNGGSGGTGVTTGTGGDGGGGGSGSGPAPVAASTQRVYVAITMTVAVQDDGSGLARKLQKAYEAQVQKIPHPEFMTVKDENSALAAACKAIGPACTDEVQALIENISIINGFAANGQEAPMERASLLVNSCAFHSSCGRDNNGTFETNDEGTFGDKNNSGPGPYTIDYGGGYGLVCHSFPAGTPVLMADGTLVPIEQVQAGDQVLAADPQQGLSRPEAVTGAIVTDDDGEFTDLSVEASGTKPATLTTTAHHPFWNTVTQRWEEARDLQAGELLQKPDGGSAALTAVNHRVGEARTYDLTVSTLHTYYVLAGATPVLVHNCDFIGPKDSVALGRDLEGPANVQDFAAAVKARHFMNSTDWEADVLGAVERLKRGEARISFMLDGLPGGGQGPERALKRAQEDFASGKFLATQWELLEIEKAGLMGRVDFYRYSPRIGTWNLVKRK